MSHFDPCVHLCPSRVHPAQMIRLAELSPAFAAKKGSPLRPCVISPEASALRVKGKSAKAKPLSRWQAPPTTHQAGDVSERSAATSETLTSARTGSTVFDDATPKVSQHNFCDLNDSITMAGPADDWDGCIATSRRDSVMAKPRLSLSIFIPPSADTFTRVGFTFTTQSCVNMLCSASCRTVMCRLLAVQGSSPEQGPSPSAAPVLPVRRGENAGTVCPVHSVRHCKHSWPCVRAQQLESGMELVMMARKKMISGSSTYLIFDMRGLSIDDDVERFTSSDPRYIAKIWCVP